VTSIRRRLFFLEDYAAELANVDRRLNTKATTTLHPALQRRFLQYIRRQKKDLRDITAAHIEELLKALRSTEKQRSGCSIQRVEIDKEG